MKPKRLYYPAVDGLRIFALISALFYHLVPNWAPGGYYGVLVFLVISGYFSTIRLLKDWNTYGKIKLIDFYRSRFKRLFPSIVWLLILSGCLFVYLGSQYLIDFRGVSLAPLPK